MKLILVTIMMLSLSLLTACGSSSGSGGDPKADPVPAVPNDLSSLDSVITADVNENQTVALTIPEYKDTNSYAFTGVDGDNFELSSEDGKVVFKVEPDFEIQPSYNFIMTVTNASDQTKDINVTINIIDIPEDLNSLPTAITESVNENHRFAFTIPEYKDTNRYAFTGVDGDKVKLWLERGEVIFNYAPDFETKNSYSFVMIVTNEMEQTKEIDVTININDVSIDFIFEVEEGSIGSLDLRLNANEQDDFHEFFFTIAKDGQQGELFEFSGNIDNQLIQIKPVNADSDEVLKHIYTITPTTEDGLPGFKFWQNYDVVKIKVIQWGDNSWKSLHGMFPAACKYDDSILLSFSDPQSAPNLTRVTSMEDAFSDCYFFENQSYWDVSNVINMKESFSSTKGDADLSQWNVSSVESMESMFVKAEDFNSNISQWVVSSVKNMKSMFQDANVFNSDISDWDVELVDDMSLMFYFSGAFDGDLSKWKTNKVQSMFGMFARTEKFNSDVSSWNIEAVTNMEGMFVNSKSFNQDISGWDVTKVANCANFKTNSILSDAYTPDIQHCATAAP